MGYEANTLERVGGGLEIRIGGGLTENWLLYAQDSFVMTSRNGQDIGFFALEAKTQYFFHDNFYFNGGVGFADAETCASSGSNVCTDSNIGLSLSAGAGYEFRLTKRFIMSPEVELYYRHIDNITYVMPSAGLHLGWYF